ncbi:SIMPL domain-containing protein [Neisseria chenwenguii]|uniref:Uncharacterized protein n=1 Tax=Neisseria chenwenguii TaxID=1853278 RepID=A0A220S488_9NEIS|nr:SIMPL domain-containing protein [Neisseria chenwenguii]ASK28236.1 hypothetical protein BG910_11270 [Neisseria chenwenguii]ROV57360.1 DUF541 domain-containing protein [Neisseria chenwenguii]
MFRTVLAAAVLAALALPAAAEPLNYNIVEFSESAGTEVARDTMAAQFQIRAEGKDRSAVSTAFTKKFNNFNRKTKGSAFKTELLSRRASPRYQYSNGKQTQTGWEENAEFKVESQDFAALNRLIAETQNDANVEHTYFSVSKKKREDAIDEVSKAAIVRFKERAQTIARTMGFSHYKIVKLSLGHIGSRSIGHESGMALKMARAMPMAESAAAPVDTAPSGVEEISITVSGSIQM